MTVSVAAPVNQSARIREMNRRYPFFTAQDLATLTGMSLKNVRAALEKGEKNDRPKSRV